MVKPQKRTTREGGGNITMQAVVELKSAAPKRPMVQHSPAAAACDAVAAVAAWSLALAAATPVRHRQHASKLTSGPYGTERTGPGSILETAFLEDPDSFAHSSVAGSSRRPRACLGCRATLFRQHTSCASTKQG